MPSFNQKSVIQGLYFELFRFELICIYLNGEFIPVIVDVSADI